MPGVVAEMGPYRHWLDDALRQAYSDATANHDLRRQLHASLALLSVDRGQVDYLRDRMLLASPQEALVIREALRPYALALGPGLWKIVEDRKADSRQRLRGACALADYASEDPRWPEVAPDVAARLVADQILDISRWAESLRPVGRHLLPPLAALIADEKRDAASRHMITGLYKDYARGLAAPYTPLEKEVIGQPGPFIDHDARLAFQQRQANAAAALAALGRWEAARRLLEDSPNPTARAI